MLTHAGPVTRACGCVPTVTLMAPDRARLDAAREKLEGSYCAPCSDGMRTGRRKGNWGGGCSTKKVREAKDLLRDGRLVDEVSMMTGINRTMIGMIKRGERWANV